jgi:hypothetical protein
MSVQDKPKTPQHSTSKSGIMPRPDLAELEARREAPQQPSTLPEARDKDGATTGIFPVISEGHDISAIGDEDNVRDSRAAF